MTPGDLSRRDFLKAGGLGVAGLSTLALASCGERGQRAGQDEGSSKANNSDETYYWISQQSTLPLFVAHDHVALKKAAKDMGVNVEITGPTGNDLGQLTATINQVCSQSPAGVMIVGWDPSLAAPTNSCVEQGVPTVTVDADLPDSNRLAFVGTDWYRIGVAQANAMIEATDGKGKVATLSIINANNMKQARRGFKDTISDTDLEVVAEEGDEGQEATAASKTASLLSAHPDLAGIAGFDAKSGPGIVRALEEANKAGDIAVTTMQASAELFKTLKTGVTSAIIIQKRELFTYYGLSLLYDYNHNGLSLLGLSKEEAQPIPKVVDTGLIVATKENADAIIKAAEENQKEAQKDE